MESAKPCAVVIFNFINFDKWPELNKRSASLIDVKRLLRLCQALNLPVELVSDPNLREFKTKVKSFSEYDFEEYSSILLVFMSHGSEKNVLYCKDGEFNFLEASETIYKNEKLKDKPKFIIVQACKGKLNVDALYDNSSSKGSALPDKLVVLTSSFEGFESYLNGDIGSRFIKSIVGAINDNWTKKSVLEMLELSTANYNGVETEQQCVLYKSTDKIPYKFYIEN